MKNKLANFYDETKHIREERLAFYFIYLPKAIESRHHTIGAFDEGSYLESTNNSLRMIGSLRHVCYNFF